MTALLPMVSIFMLAFSTILLELLTGTETKPADRSHLDDPNPHLEELVVWTEVRKGKSVRV